MKENTPWQTPSPKSRKCYTPPKLYTTGGRDGGASRTSDGRLDVKLSVPAVSVATVGDVRDQPRVADAASELLQHVFGKDKSPCRLVYGVASLPLGTPVELEVIFEVG
jgi:hypothetical protein